VKLRVRLGRDSLIRRRISAQPDALPTVSRSNRADDTLERDRLTLTGRKAPMALLGDDPAMQNNGLVLLSIRKLVKCRYQV
jgi:hypothetical protein